MKKLFIALAAMLISVAAFSQIDNPELKLQNLSSPYSGQSAIKKHGSPSAPLQFDSTWAAQFQETLDLVMQQYGGQGMSMAVYTPEEGLWAGVSGVSNPFTPMTTDMRFGIGSNTKLFIAVAILKLIEQGLLTLEDQIVQYLPSYQWVDSTTTIRQLLAHESGIFDFWNDTVDFIDLALADTSRFWLADELLAGIGPPHFAPGNGYRYSNTNYILAAKVMEAVTGETWVEVLHDQVFDPLELENTFVGAYEPRNGPVASEWCHPALGGITVWNPPMTAEYSQANACGSILSTPSEMVMWYNSIFNEGFLSPSSMELLLDFEPTSLAGLGIFHGGYPYGFYNHTGGMFGFITMMLYDYQRGAVISIFCNERESNIIAKWNSLLDVFFTGYPKYENDAGIASILSPWDHNCDTIVLPQVELINYGMDPLTSVSVHYKVDNGEVFQFDWTGMLDPGETDTLDLAFVSAGLGNHRFYCYTSMPNGEPEGYNWNDTAFSDFFINVSTPLIYGFYEGFDDEFSGDGWTLNPSSIQQWERTPLARLDGTGSFVKNNWDSYNVIGRYYDFQLPVIDLTGWENKEFSFYYAYSTYPGTVGDSLEVSVSEDCGQSWVQVFYDGGISLSNYTVSSELYYPSSEDDWHNIALSLDDFEGEILIRFRMRYGYGNLLYLDNIQVGSPVSIAEGNGSSLSRGELTIYPNPFTSYTTLAYHLEERAVVSITIFDYLGHQITVLDDEIKDAGSHTQVWDPSHLQPGIYICRIQVGNTVSSKKIVKLK